MLAHNRIIFALHHFFGEIARVFTGYVEKAGIRRADEFDFYIGWFRHGAFLKSNFLKVRFAQKSWCNPQQLSALMLKPAMIVKKKHRNGPSETVPAPFTAH